MSIPYVKGVSESLKRTLSKYDINVAFKADNTIGKKVTKLKDPIKPLE